MSNHYHIVLKLESDAAARWSSEEVLKRWCFLFNGSLLVQKKRRGEPLNPHEQETLAQTVAVYRDRLKSLSWFMKCLNEPIARRANAEDECSGHFWEARFTSQALSTEQALLACMVYVDLNPVRAGLAETPENSPHTSIRERIRPSETVKAAVHKQLNVAENGSGTELKMKPLIPFRSSKHHGQKKNSTALPISLSAYLELLEFTGRVVRPDKPCAIRSNQPPILKRLAISVSDWNRYSTDFEKQHRIRELRAAATYPN